MVDRKPVLHDDRFYFTDNGAILCGRHAGVTARYTGRDISGQKVERITPEMALAFNREMEAAGLGHLRAACETCRRPVPTIEVVTRA